MRQFAAFLVVAGHLRRRMGESFVWYVGPSSTSAAGEDIMDDNDAEPDDLSDDDTFWSKGGTGSGKGGESASRAIAEHWRLQQEQPSLAPAPRRSLWSAIISRRKAKENATTKDSGLKSRLMSVKSLRRTMAMIFN
jgi:hypothetical protein